jgi:hypothetical protein
MPKKRSSLRSSRDVVDDSDAYDDYVDSEDSESESESESNVDEDSVDTDTSADSFYDDSAPSASNDDSNEGKIHEVNDDDEEERSEELNKLCYRLATESLTELDIQLSCIVSVAREIAGLLPSNSSLKKLGLEFSRGRPEAEELYQRNTLMILCSGLAANSYVADIQIRNADLNRDVAFLLGATFAQNQSAQKICLKSCNLIDSGLAVLFLGMQRNKQIQELAILSCDLSDFDSDVVAASVPLMNLKSLTLNNTKLTVEGLRFLCERIKNSPNLVELNLSGHALGRRGMKVLISCLKSPNQKVGKLNLSFCGLDNACIKHLSKCLVQNPTLFSLNLSDNDFGDDGAVFLKLLLNENNSIKELYLHGCRISKRRLRLIADGLRYNNSFLKVLFSESVSLAILESVDVIENLGSAGSAGAAR